MLISHETLMQWAIPKGRGPAINSSTAIRLEDGSRLVRDKNMIRDAEREGWDDLAAALSLEIATMVKGGVEYDT
jgi:hypothetical protein